LVYQFTEKPNKSNALNEVLRKGTNEFILFFDDDVRIHPDTLLNYVKEVGDRTNGFFPCGRVRVDYEDEPPQSDAGLFPSLCQRLALHEGKVPDGGAGRAGSKLGGVRDRYERGGRIRMSAWDLVPVQ